MDAASARRAWVTNVPDYCIGKVSDHAVALLLAFHRGIVRLNAKTKATGWAFDGRGPQRIADLTVGILGYGRIGRETGRKLQALGCPILVVTGADNRSTCDGKKTSMQSVQENADVIILHAPLTDTTFHMIDHHFLSCCRRSPLIIKVSRGPLIDNYALMAALDAGRIRGAALDVVEGEPFPPPALLAREDVVVTPHITFASAAALAELRGHACEEVVRAIKGEPLHHPCNRPNETALIL